MQRKSPVDNPNADQPSSPSGDTDAAELESPYRIVVASESTKGTIGFDERGQPQWKWVTELGTGPIDGTGTFDQLKALDNPALSLELEEPQAASDPSKTVGYDPYATGIFEKPKRQR